MSQSYEAYGLDFSLFPKQQLLLAHPDYTKDVPNYEVPKEVLYGGAAGGAKSYGLRATATILAIECPGVNIYLFRKTYSELDSNHMLGPNGFRAWLSSAVENKIVRIDSSKNLIQFKNGPGGKYAGGSVIFLRHVQHEKDMYLYQGAEIHVLMLDEATHFTTTIYNFLRSRVRVISWKPPEKFAGYFPRILLGSNPGGVSHNALRRGFVDQADKVNPYRPFRAPEEEGGMLRQYIPSTVYDNPVLLEEDPGYIDRLKGLGSPELVKAMLEGNWDIVAGGMFDDVWDSRVHVMSAFPVPPSWHIFRGFDWGSSKPFAVLWVAISDGMEVEVSPGVEKCWPRGTMFVIDEWYGNDKRARDPDTGLKMSNIEIGQGIRSREDNNKVLVGIRSRIFPGPADNSIYTVINNESYANGINSGYWGTTDMKNTDIFFPSDKSPGSRVKRWGLIRDRLRNSMDVAGALPMEKPGLFIFSNCRDLIRTLPTASRDDRNPEDIQDVEDHILDTLGYICLYKTGSYGRMKVSLGG